MRAQVYQNGWKLNAGGHVIAGGESVGQNEYSGLGGGAVASAGITTCTTTYFTNSNGTKLFQDGTLSVPGIGLIGEPTTGFIRQGAGQLCSTVLGTSTFCSNMAGIAVGGPGAHIGFSSTTNPAAAGADVGLSRLAVKLFAIDDGGTNNKNGFFQNGNTVRLTADFTDASGTALQTITGFSWTLPAFANSYNFHCNLNYSQATAAVADAFGVQGATTAPTNLVASAIIYTAAGTSTSGNSGNVATTTATNVSAFTPSATATVFTAMLDGQIEVGASGSSLNILVSQTTAANLITIKRGSYCQLF
jgi:hypothetical protein